MADPMNSDSRKRTGLGFSMQDITEGFAPFIQTYKLLWVDSINE